MGKADVISPTETKDEINKIELNIATEKLNKVTGDLDQVQNAKLALRRVHTEDKVEGGVVPVNELVVRATDETESR